MLARAFVEASRCLKHEEARGAQPRDEAQPAATVTQAAAGEIIVEQNATLEESVNHPAIPHAQQRAGPSKLLVNQAKLEATQDSLFAQTIAEAIAGWCVEKMAVPMAQKEDAPHRLLG